MKRRAQICERALASRLAVFGHVLRDRGLEPAEAELERARAADVRPRQRDRARIAFGREPIDARATRIAEAEQLRDLVERLAGRVVARAAEHAVIAEPGHQHELAVPTRDRQRQVRNEFSRRDLRVAEKRRE